MRTSPVGWGSKWAAPKDQNKWLKDHMLEDNYWENSSHSTKNNRRGHPWDSTNAFPQLTFLLNDLCWSFVQVKGFCNFLKVGRLLKRDGSLFRRTFAEPFCGLVFMACIQSRYYWQKASSGYLMVDWEFHFMIAFIMCMKMVLITYMYSPLKWNDLLSFIEVTELIVRNLYAFSEI